MLVFKGESQSTWSFTPVLSGLKVNISVAKCGFSNYIPSPSSYKNFKWEKKKKKVSINKNKHKNNTEECDSTKEIFLPAWLR